MTGQHEMGGRGEVQFHLEWTVGAKEPFTALVAADIACTKGEQYSQGRLLYCHDGQKGRSGREKAKRSRQSYVYRVLQFYAKKKIKRKLEGGSTRAL